MESHSKHPHRPATQDDPSSPREPVAAPPDTLQSRKDREERRKHAASENELQSAQDKNPVAPDSTRE